ncbi:MAG TPA: energy transducer TonB [Thermoanaerobaculia bacterium]|jgi:TonB family protein
MRSSRLTLNAFAVGLALSATVLMAQATAPPEPPSFARLDDKVAHDQIASAAAELAAIATQAGSTRPALKPDEEAILRRAIKAGRSHVEELSRSVAERQAARELVCLARAYFAEELPELSSSPEAAEPLRVGGGVTRPELISQIRPEYPQAARDARVRGTVIVEAVIDREGCVRKVSVLKGLPFRLEDSAVAAVRNWSFEPSTLAGRPVKVYYVLTVNFE